MNRERLMVVWDWAMAPEAAKGAKEVREGGIWRAIAAAAKRVTAPVLVSLGKQIPVANDLRTRQTVRWNGHVRVICPVESDGLQVLRAATQ